jgi:hypothetical protein
VKLRDRHTDERVSIDAEIAKLDALAVRLRECEAKLGSAEAEVAAAEAKERELEGLAAELFAQTVSEAEHDRRRAEVTTRALTARRQRDDAKEIVAAGRRACEEQMSRICAAVEAECEEAKARHELDLVAAHARVRQIETAMQQVEARRFSYTYAETGWYELKARFDRRAAAELETRRLKQRVAQLPRETPEQAREREAATLLGARTLDGDGREVAAYSRLPLDGSPVRLSP